MAKKRITRKDAIKAENLEAFVAQAEADGMPSADAAEFAAAITAAAKPQRSARQTSRSSSRGGGFSPRGIPGIVKSLVI
jgi:hypothetical protein